MSESVGTIGQKYENRKSGKRGVLVSRDESKKVLNFLDSESGEPFTVTFASFKSNWRKATDGSGNVEAVDEEVVAEYTANEPADEKDLIDEFIKAVGAVRKIHFTTNPKQSTVTELTIDGVTALKLAKDDGGVRVQALPDLYTYSDLKLHVVAGTLHFDSDDHLAVSFVSDYERFGDILNVITEAAVEINLYGYVID